jgi:hypothetical protein
MSASTLNFSGKVWDMQLPDVHIGKTVSMISKTWMLFIDNKVNDIA